MKRSKLGMIVLLGVVVLSGCQSSPRRRPGRLASAEPGLDPAPGEGTVVTEAPPAKTITIVDRHPLFSRPKYYYNSSGDNPVVKGAAATIVGVPAGIYGEIKQIVVGRPVEEPVY